ncbi:hypothetical protein MMC16_003295 [Acarospora aff. strigata]|nr:hypothetical protein [Acarospora aff. strigata]
MLEQQQAQLVNGLHQLYRRIHTGQGWSGSPLQDSGSGHPLTHEILARLGALESDGRGDVESFEEDFNIMQQKLIEDGSDFAQRHDSGDSDSEHGQSPAAFLEPLSLKPTFFSEPFPLNQLPPTPPTHSPYPYPDRSGLPKPLSNASPRTRALQAHHRMNMDPAALRHQSWGPPPVNYDENTDFGHQLELPTLGHSIAGDFNRQSMAMNSMSPRGPMPDWNEEDFGAFLNPTIMI